MTIYRCDKCSREDGEEYPPCIFIATMPGRAPDTCIYCTPWGKKREDAEWKKVDKMPEEVKV